ncbi:MAG: Ig-like domain-containing protein [Eubacterium sp.]|nr:Ig-like domain-containing protein [Eubacterium sp.]
MKRKSKKLLSVLLAVLMAVTSVIPAASAFAGDGVEGYWDIELFYKDTDTIVPSYVDESAEEKEVYVETMKEGQKLNLTYKLIDTEMPDNGYVKWYSDMPTLVDIDQNGVVKAFDSSKGAVIQNWIDNEVKPIPLVGKLMATVLEKAFFNDKVDIDSMDTEAIIDIVEAAFGSDSPIAGLVDSYKGELIDSLRKYLNNINSVIHVALYDKDGKELDNDSLRINVVKNDEWYAAFLPNGTHITNKSQIPTTVAVGSTVQLSAITTPLRLHYGTMYSVKSSSIFTQGKVVATVNDSGLVTFKNKGKVTILASPDTDDIINGILGLVNKFYQVSGTIDSDKLAGILIDYVGIDMNRAVLAAILDACFAIKDVVGGSTDPVQLTATAVKLISNLVLQFAYNDSITFEVVDAQPLESFDIEGANTVQEGSQIQLSITNIQPTTGDTSDITWTSSNPEIASVDPVTGTITGRDAGGSLGSLSSQKCTITATSAANGVTREIQLTVTGKTGKYLSDVEITGTNYLEMGQETDLSYQVFPKRVAESNNLYVTWGMVTGEDEDGNTTYSWATDDAPATDGRGQIDKTGHYKVVSGGNSTVVLKAQTGYYLSNSKFYEISSKTATFDMSNGIPVENITISVDDALGIASSINKTTDVNVGDRTYKYVSIKAGTQYAGLGAQLSATVEPENASNKNLTWVVDNSYYSQDISDDTHTIKVKQKAGHENADSFNIYAVSADGKTKSNEITVTVAKDTTKSNTIDEDSYSVTRGQTVDATHTMGFSGADGTYSACYKCNWYSSDENVFTVETKNNDNRDATITGVDVGTATLYCVSADGGYVDTAQVTVYPDKDYLKNIVSLCDSTTVLATDENSEQYDNYCGSLDLAYYVLYDSPMASQDTCDTYASQLLYDFYKLGGFVGILGVDILGTNKTPLSNNHVTVKVPAMGIYTNYKYDFDMQLKPENAMYNSINWTSSNPNIAIDKNGIARPTKNEACSAMITCTVTDYMGTKTSTNAFVTFAKVPATGVSLNTDTIEGGKIGETQTLTATVTPKGTPGIGASCTDVYWSSSDENIATVDQNGVVTFKEGGDCVITCQTYDGGYEAKCNVNVVTNYTELENLVKSYKDQQLNQVNYYPDSWETYQNALNKAQDMIDKGGYSQAQVNAMVTELEEAFNGLVKYNYIQKIELYLDGEPTKDFYQYDLSVLKDGISYKNAVLDLNVRLYPNNGSYKSVTWESSNELISVTQDGKCTPTQNKSCYGLITCTVEDHFGNKYQDTVWVSYAFNPVTEVVVSPSSIAGALGTTAQLSKTIKPEGSSLPPHIGKASIQDVYWESDDESIATVDENGLVTFVSAGATTVRCVSYDGGIYGECHVSSDGDRTALKAAVDEYKDIDYKDYAYSYGQAFKSAYDAANDALTDDTLTQDNIDEITAALIAAHDAMIEHPYVHVTGADITYQTAAKPLIGGYKDVESGTIGDNNSISVNLLSDKYSNYNDYNKITLTSAALPSGAMYKTAEWSVVDSSGVDTSINDQTITVQPKSRNSGGWAKVKMTYTDEYGRTFERTINVTMSDKITTGFDIKESALTYYVTDNETQLEYTLSGSPEFSNITWTSSNEDAVKVSQDGKLTFVEKGEAVITGTTFDGGFTDKVKVTVLTDFNALAAKQNEYNSLIEEVKDSYTYTKASLDVLSAAVAEAKTMIDEGKATQAEADAMLKKLNDAYNSLVLYVATEGVEIGYYEETGVTNPNPGYFRYTGSFLNGKSISLIANEQPKDSIYKSIEWTSSNDKVSVSESGVVTNNSATAEAAQITCKITNEKDETYSSTVTVTFVRYGVTGISFADEKVFGAPAQTVTLSPKFEIGGSLSVIKDCTYVSDNKDVATVDDNGVVTFISQGCANITATAKDGGYTATIKAYTTWDTTALKAAIDEADKITPTDYEVSYANAFTAALDKANKVYANMEASQTEIDEACEALVAATNALEGHEFIVPEINVKNGDTVLDETALVQVPEDTQKTTLSLALNDGAMVKSTDISVSDQNGVNVTVSGNDINVTKTADTGSFKLAVKVVDEWGREYNKEYTINVINIVIPVTSLELTVDGNAVTDGKYTASAGGRYSKFTGVTVGYIPTPADANAITSVTYTADNATNFEIDSNGKLTLTGLGKISVLSQLTTNVTVTVTNADGSTAQSTFKFALTRA